MADVSIESHRITAKGDEMKIREEFAEFWESVKLAASGFVDWACWHFQEIAIVLLLSTIAGLFVWLITASEARESELMQQCVQDGRKEYECAAMLRTDADTAIVVMPR